MTHTTLTLNNGVEMPALGFGVFQTPPEDTAAAVREALRVGYRHIDTAASYGNEREVGRAIADSDMVRRALFLETKVWISDYGYEQTLHAFDKATGKLGVEQLDLLILHQPLPAAFERTIAAYRALEELYREGKVRAIGVSNFMPEHLTRLLEETEVVPAVNQIELHPFFQQPDLTEMNSSHGIVSQAWSPIGGITFYTDDQGDSVLDDPTLAQIASEHDRTLAQVMLRWHLQRGRSAIPKSVTPSRIAENHAVFDFELTDEELRRIDGLDRGVRRGPDPASITLDAAGKTIPEA